MRRSKEKELRYRDVPQETSRRLANLCWNFGDQAYWTLEDLEGAAKRIFNARLTADPQNWNRRIDEAEGALENVEAGLKKLHQQLERIKKLAPKTPNEAGKSP